LSEAETLIETVALLEKDYEFFHARLDKASCRNKEVVAFILKGFLCLGYIGGAMLFFNVSALALPWECKALLLLGASICGVSMLTKDEVQRGKEFLENIGVISFLRSNELTYSLFIKIRT
jgi:hypothetical protein